MKKKTKLLVVTAVWGDWHISKYFDLNLPTLLTERNFPALAQSCEITYLIYTSQKDMARVSAAPGLQSLAKLMKVQFKLISPKLLKDPIVAHHEIWAQATQQAKSESSLVLLMPPDVAWSEGSFAHVGSLLEVGKKVIFMTYLRVESESFTKELKRYHNADAPTISVSGQQLVEVGMRTLHPLMAASIRESSNFPIHPEMMFWVVPNEGLLCRVLAREMFIYDPASLRLNSVNLLETKVSLDQVHMVDDSDNLFAVSLTPYDKDFEWYRWPRKADPWAIAQWWLNYDSWINDFIANTKIRWHYKPVTENLWQAKEQGSDVFLRRTALIREVIRLHMLLLKLKYNISASHLLAALYTGVIARARLGRGGAIIFLPVDAAYKGYPEANYAPYHPNKRRALIEFTGAHLVPSKMPSNQLSLEKQLGSLSSIDLTAADGSILKISRIGAEFKVNESNIIDNPVVSGKNLIYFIGNHFDL